MKRNTFLNLLNDLLVPVMLVGIGLVLLVNPDAATILVTRVLAWILMGVGLLSILYTVMTWPVGRVQGILWALIGLGLGGFLLGNPLFLAKNLSRFLGILLAGEAGASLYRGTASKTMCLITLGVGVVLVLSPMTASRLMFALCGIVLMAVGGGLIWDRFRYRKLDSGDDDPNIIDAL